MPVPGAAPEPVPASAGAELFVTDAFVREFGARVVALDAPGRRVAFDRTAFYPGGGGQPHDVGRVQWAGVEAPVLAVRRDGPHIWHELGEADADLPQPGEEVFGVLDWARRHLLMRTHTALHILCGVIYAEYEIPVTGGNMTPGEGRLDFPLESMSADLGHRVETRINEEIERARDIMVRFVGRAEADGDPALIRTRAGLIPREIDPLRVIDIVGLDTQADGGTHVASTADVGRVEVVGTSSKGRGNKRIRLAVRDR